MVNFTVETGTGITINSSVTNTSPAVVDLLFGHDILIWNSSYSNRNKGIHVYSQNNELISVLVISSYNFSWNIGGEYLVHPYQHFQTNQYRYIITVDTFWFWVLLVGNEDNTTITVVVTQSLNLPQDVQSSANDTVFIPAGSAYTLTLHKLQTFLFNLQLDDGDTWLGTNIISNKPLTVIYFSSSVWSDTEAEQVSPTVTWGKKFLLVPYFIDKIHSWYNPLDTCYDIIAAESQTTLSFACGSSTNTSYLYNAGDFITVFSNNSYCSITSDKPILVIQSLTELFIWWESVISSITPPVRQYSSSVTIVFPENAFYMNHSHYVNIAVTANDTVLLNGEILFVKWNAIFDENNNVIGYGAQIAMLTNDSTSYTITTLHNTPFSLMIYGLHEYYFYQYSYSAGTHLNQLVKSRYNY